MAGILTAGGLIYKYIFIFFGVFRRQVCKNFQNGFQQTGQSGWHSALIIGLFVPEILRGFEGILVLQRHLIAKNWFIVPKYEARNPKF